MARRSDAIERFTEEAEASGLQVEVQRYPDGTRTAADAAAAVGCHVDQIVKSLVFMADVRPVLVLCSGGRRVDEERLASYLGTEIRIAGASEVRAATGFAIGGTPPFGTHRAPPHRRRPTPHGLRQGLGGRRHPRLRFPVKPKDLVQATAGAVVGSPADPWAFSETPFWCQPKLGFYDRVMAIGTLHEAPGPKRGPNRGSNTADSLWRFPGPCPWPP
ncbi:MAG: hypothetical protein Ct9H300mP31_20590 [Acidimicrobiaceae bacterium]|nr:MAG: hypothetical protein Ct9H300mP31_20590 [Acidimicrobiaceae bacterium]